MRVKKFVPNKKGDIGMEVHYVCQPNTPMSLPSLLLTKFTSNDIGVGLIYVVYLNSYVPFFIWNEFFTLTLYKYIHITFSIEL